MSKKPLDIYSVEDWRFTIQPKLEGQWFERKGHPPTRTPTNLREFKEKIARAICSFANSNPHVGGLFVVGLGDRGERYGVDHHGSDYLNTILSYAELLDGPTAEHKLVEFMREDGITDHLVFIYTRFLPQRVARTTDGQCFRRHGDKTVALRVDEAQAFAYDKGELHFEDEPALLLNEDDLEPGIVKEFIEQYVQTRRISETMRITDILRLARLVTSKDEQIWLTKGGLLVFHKDPRLAIPGAYVRYFRYEGRDKQSSTLIRDEQFEGPLPIIIQKLREFLPTQVSRFSYRSVSGALTSEDEYPATAWDEAIVNALIHRSYSQQTRPVWVEHFDDHIAVTSPGSYPLGVTPENLIHTPRNTNTMEALRHLNFVRMAEEGTKAMRQAMIKAGLSEPLYSPPDLDRVTCTLLNNIDERLRNRGDPKAGGRTSPTTIVCNLYPLIVRPPTIHDAHEPLLSDGGKPTFQEIRESLIQAFRSADFRVDSFTQSTAIDVTEEYVVPALKRSGIAAIYPGIEFQLREFGYGLYLILDHTVQVRNRLNAAEVQRSLPWLSLGNRRRSFARVNDRWAPGFILDAGNENWNIELLGEDRNDRTVISVDAKNVIPDLKTVELTALLGSRNIPVQLFHEVRKASLIAVKEAPRQRLERLRMIVESISQRVFPLAVGRAEVQLTPTPAPLNRSPFYLGHRLRDPKAQFDNKGLRQEDDIIRGLTTFGSFQKPATEIPLVVVCSAVWSSKMHAFVQRLRQGHQRYRGMEATFGVRLGGVTTVIAEIAEYEAKVTEAIAQIPDGARPIFIVLAPERGVSRADYNAPYYRIKRLLFEAGYPSQMVDEDTLDDPNWKDLNFALDLFAKAGYVPWVLSEGMPRADLFIGLSSSIISHQGQRRRVVGYANVFDEYGRWLFYEGASEAVPYEERNAMFAELLTKIVRNYRAKRRKPGWVHIHHSARLSQIDRAEIARGILREAEEAELSFVYINEHSSFRLFDTSGRGDGAAERGTWLKLSPNSLLIATTGPNPIGQKYLGTPRPLEVRVNRVQERGPLDLADYVQQILSLTRLNWASSRSFCHTPITIKFANDIAYLMNVFLSTGSTFRLHEQLRGTPWFL